MLTSLGAFAELRKATISFVVSVRPCTSNSSVPIGQIFMKLDIWAFFRKSVEKIQVSLKSDKDGGYFTRRRMCIYDTPRLLLGMRNVSGKRRIKAQNTHLILPPPLFPKIVPLWDIVEKYDRARQATHDSIIRRLCVAALIRKATDAHSEYVIRIALMQQWLHERAWMLRCAYIAFIVNA